MIIMQSCGIVSTAVLYIFLGRTLGPWDYGIAGIIISALTLLRTGVFGALVMTTAKLIAGDPHRAYASILVSKKAYATVATALILLLLLLARPMASALGDVSLTPYFRLLVVSVPPLAFYLLLLGVLTGLKDFATTMLAGITFQILKLGVVVLLVLLGLRVYGLIFGFAAASLFAYLIFQGKSRIEQTAERTPVLRYFTTAFGLWLTVTLAVVQRYINLLNLKRIVVDSDQVGYYSAAGHLASIPALVFSGFAVALWPSISGAAGRADFSLARYHLQKSFRYLLVALLPFAGLVSALPGLAIRVSFGKQFLPAATVLPFMVLGLVLVSVQSLLMSGLLALGKAGPTSAVLLCSIGAVVAIGNVAIPRWGMMGAALTELFGFALSGVVFGLMAWRRLGPYISLGKAARILLSALAFFVVLRSFAFCGLAILVVIACAAALYLLLLHLLGIISKNEMRTAYSFVTGWLPGKKE